MNIQIIYFFKTLLLPPASLLILAITGLILISKHRNFGFLILKISIGALFMFSLPVVSGFIAGSQEIYPAIGDAHLVASNAQVIVVLGGGTRPNAREYENRTTVHTRVLERLRYAARLARLTKLPILVSGGKVFNQAEPSEASVMTEVLREDFHTTVAFQEDQSRNTAENAQYSFALLANSQINRIILVTHAVHMTRAVERFERVGFKVLPAPTFFISSLEPVEFLDFLPSIQGLLNSQMAIHELVGRWWYRLKYSN